VRARILHSLRHIGLAGCVWTCEKCPNSFLARFANTTLCPELSDRSRVHVCSRRMIGHYGVSPDGSCSPRSSTNPMHLGHLLLPNAIKISALIRCRAKVPAGRMNAKAISGQTCDAQPDSDFTCEAAAVLRLAPSFGLLHAIGVKPFSLCRPLLFKTLSGVTMLGVCLERRACHMPS